METKPTPMPWKARPIFGHEGKSALFWSDTSKGGVHERRIDDGGLFEAQDAASIVRACNAHDALIGMLKVFVEGNSPPTDDDYRAAQKLIAQLEAV